MSALKKQYLYFWSQRLVFGLMSPIQNRPHISRTFSELNLMGSYDAFNPITGGLSGVS